MRQAGGASLCRIFEAYDDPFAEFGKRGLNPVRPGIVFRVQHTTYDRLADTETFCQIRIPQAILSHRQIERKLRSQVERNANQMLAPCNSGGSGNGVSAPDPSREGFGQAIRGLHLGVIEISTPC